MAGHAEITARELLILARSTANTLRERKNTPTLRLALCRQLLAEAQTIDTLKEFAEAISTLDDSSRHYWIGTFYSLLMPTAERRSRAAYFTPPHLAEGIVALARRQGFDLQSHTAIDPAAGGAAFLSTLAQQMREAGGTTPSILKRLNGIEIDSGLARLSEALIAERLETKISKGSIVRISDSLASKTASKFDLVIANPPYGRISLSDLTSKRWQHVCHPGHINKYALFTELCFRLAKRSGLVALVLPSSFIAGPLYDLLRTFIREHGEILTLGAVTSRHDVFADVAQDISVILARAGSAHRGDASVAFGTFTDTGNFKGTTATKLPKDSAEPWPVPNSIGGLSVGGNSLSDFGAKARAGYFVWNREKERMLKGKTRKLDIPLVWAKNVKAGSFCNPQARRGNGVDYVRFDKDTSAIVRGQALVMQRTTNSAQARRLVVGRISPKAIKKWGGFVSENHTIVITAPDIKTLNDLCLLLNSKAVDARYRQLSGTASVSVQLLRSLDLPCPSVLRASIAKFGNTEAAVEKAYAESAANLLEASA